MKILILTGFSDDKTILRVKKIPIAGVVIKDEAPESLLQAVQAIAQGNAWFSDSIVAAMIANGTGKMEDGPRQLLTNREIEILTRIGYGYDNKRIADELFLSAQTVRNYAATIYGKISIKTRVEAAMWAQKHRLCDNPDPMPVA